MSSSFLSIKFSSPQCQQHDFTHTNIVNVEQNGKYWIYRLSSVSFQVILTTMISKMWQGDRACILSWLVVFSLLIWRD